MLLDPLVALVQLVELAPLGHLDLKALLEVVGGLVLLELQAPLDLLEELGHLEVLVHLAPKGLLEPLEQLAPMEVLEERALQGQWGLLDQLGHKGHKGQLAQRAQQETLGLLVLQVR